MGVFLTIQIGHFLQTHQFPILSKVLCCCPQIVKYCISIVVNSTNTQTRFLAVMCAFWLCGSFLYVLLLSAEGHLSCLSLIHTLRSCLCNNLHREIPFPFLSIPFLIWYYYYNTLLRCCQGFLGKSFKLFPIRHLKEFSILLHSQEDLFLLKNQEV